MSWECSDAACNSDIAIMKTLWDITCTLIWIVGVTSNFVNILIFSHKNMQSPINSILWWLAVSDLIELLIIALYGWCCGWCPYIDFFFPGPFENSLDVSVLFLISIYLLQVFHSITIGLNVILAFWRYKYLSMRNSVRRKSRGEYHSIRKTVFLQYVLCFLTGSLVFYALKIHKGNGKNTYIVYYRPSKVTDTPVVIQRDSFLVEACTITYGFILRVLPLILLTVKSIELIFFLSRDGETRRKSSIPSIIKTQRQIDRINTLISWILFMFVIVEIPFTVSGVLRVIGNLKIIPPEVFIISTEVLPYVQKITLLINSSSNITYYLIISSQYRKTMKLLLYNIRHNRRIYTSESVATRSDLELTGHL